MLVVVWLAIRGARRTRSMADYAVGSVNFSPVAVGLSLAASMTSAATFIINPGFIGLYGISGVLSFGIVMPLAIFVSLVVLTKGFRKIGSANKALTMAQWVGTRYQRKGFALFFGFLSLLLITFIVLICVGLTQVLSKSLNADPIVILAVIVAIVFGYMMFGGANTMVYTNATQAVLMLVVAIILLGSGFDHFSNGVNAFLDKLRQIDPNLASTTNPESFLFRDYFEIIVCQIVIGIAIVCQPHIITKSLLLKSAKDVNRYLAVGIGVEAIFFLVVIVGLYARLTFPDMTLNGQPLPMDALVSTYVVQRFPAYVGVIVVMGLLSAGLSTLEGLVQSLSTTITADILQPLVGKRLFTTPGRQVAANRVVIVLLAVVSFALSYQQLLHPALSVGIFAQNGVYAFFAAAFVPVLFGTFIKHVHPLPAMTAAVTALVVHFGSYYGRLGPYMQQPVNNPGIAATYAIVSALTIGTLLHLFTRQRTIHY